MTPQTKRPTGARAAMAVRLRLPAWMLPVLLLAVVVTLVSVIVLRAATTVSGGDVPVVTGAVKNTIADLQPGAVPPDFSATTYDGRTLSLSGLKGKVVLLNFFASWCGECRAEFPDLQAAWLKHRAKGFEVVGVDAIDGGDGRRCSQRDGRDLHRAARPRRRRAPGPIAHAYAITTGLPVSVFIDRTGRVHQLYPGRIDAQVIAQQLAQMGINS